MSTRECAWVWVCGQIAESNSKGTGPHIFLPPDNTPLPPARLWKAVLKDENQPERILRRKVPPSPLFVQKGNYKRAALAQSFPLTPPSMTHRWCRSPNHGLHGAFRVAGEPRATDSEDSVHGSHLPPHRPVVRLSLPPPVCAQHGQAQGP